LFTHRNTNKESLFSSTTVKSVCSLTNAKGKSYKKEQVLAAKLGKDKIETSYLKKIEPKEPYIT
jgi:thiazole synthase ThiGH ThiG subunit